MQKSHAIIVGMAAAVLALGCAGLAEAVSLEMNRNTDDTAMYKALTCATGPTCVPTTPTPEMDIAQPATGKPTKVIPPALSGRIAYMAQDAVGNQSQPSVAIPFRGAALNVPTGLQQLP